MKPVKTYTSGIPHYIEADGSITINCNEGEVTMSTRSFGQVGKSYSSASEAFKDADYAQGIEMPQKGEYDHLWAIFGVIAALGLVVWIFTRF
ncbi:hypothetical protein UFOVP202_48 [uncultured Caudovirales phage]|uniref:Uncharacterized protein n=1 Tax=uncultured Caudovirales phage TaxID=2100421 RepID=A0A6J7WRY2_9CAUD|nr:hypothetical protein UFOVP202_48 [uncultured Caudovirales phage]